MDRSMSRDTHPWVAEGQGKLRFGITLPTSPDAWSEQRDFAQAIDELGFDSAWVGDHPLISSDCWTPLAAFAVVTRRVRLVSTSCAAYRSSAMLARQAADVDRLSRSHFLNFVVLAETPSALAEKVNAVPAMFRARSIFRACTPPDLVEFYRPVIDAGAQYLVLGSPFQFDLATARLFAEQVVPELQDYFRSIRH